MIHHLTILSAALLIILAGCAGGESGNGAAENPPAEAGSTARAEPAGDPYDPTSATAGVWGSITFNGTPPQMPMLQMAGDFYCTRNALGTRDNEVAVTDDGLLENVIVYVRSGHDDSLYYAPPSDPVVLDQARCVYVPRTLTIMTGQELLVRNSDDTFHNVHSQSNLNTTFNFGQPEQGQENTRTFATPEMPVTIGCDIHRWMRTSIGVFDHPFHATSGGDGSFELELPPGTYEVVAWHERYGEQTAMIEVVDGDTAQIDFTFVGPEG